ncbi:MAG: hypothetical protein C0424_00795 [Sphingobacteriaceae bacterium]|nr:hypothetical protein [Sphingobacteriaceae bacterium]
MKKVLALLVFVGFGTTAMAQAPATATPAVDKNKGEMKFEKELHDFGTVNQGEPLSFDFVFTNSGKEPVIISNVSASCGCTTPSWTKEPVKAGQKGSIKAVYNSQILGPFTKQVTVTSNAGTSTKVLTIKGNVVAQPAGVPENKTNASPVTKP